VTALRRPHAPTDIGFEGLRNQQFTAFNEQDLEDLLLEHGPVVTSALERRYLGLLGRQDLEDVLTIALGRIWKARERIGGVRSIRAWFLRIADNAAKDTLRLGWQKARRLEVELQFETGNTTASPIPISSTPSRKAAEVREIVEGLPEIQRKIVWSDALCPHGPVPADQLGRELGISPGNVRVYRKRALDRIRSEFAKRNVIHTGDSNE